MYILLITLMKLLNINKSAGNWNYLGPFKMEKTNEIVPFQLPDYLDFSYS